MGSACGIHIDQHRFRLVALEGSVRKHRVSARLSEEIPAGADPVAHVAAELKKFVKANKLTPDGVSLAVDSGLAAFRSLSLPFDDRGKIEEVIKFEVETDLPQWDIDDVIVDFHVTDSKPGVSSDLLVTAIPKERLARQLAACEQAGLEPTEAELEGTALFSAASEAGLLDEESAQLLVHIGDATTAVVVVDGGRLVSMRAIHVGGGLRRHEVEAPDGDDGEPAPAEPESEHDAEERLARNAQRVQRELARTVSGVRTRHDLEAIYVFGGSLPGFDGGSMLELPVERPNLLPEDEPAEDSSELTVAYGAALRQLGLASSAGHLRREELRYSGKFERLELPLAVFLLLLAFLLGVKLRLTYVKLGMLDEGVVGQEEEEGYMQFWLRVSNLWMLPDAERLWPGRLKNPPATVVDYARRAEQGADPDRTKFEELREIRRRLEVEILALEKDLGISKRTTTTGEIPMPQSALRALTLVFDKIDELGEDIGRIGIRKIKADSQTKSNGAEQYVSIKLDMDFFADGSLQGNEATIEATQHYSNFVNAIQKAPWYRDFQRKPTDTFDGGIGSDGMTIEVDLSRIPLEDGETEGEA